MLDTVRWLTPQAALGSWYQERFDAPIASNAAQVATAFAQIDDLIDQCDRPIVLAGFSQGACLAAEYVLQSRKTVTALIALTGSRLRNLRVSDQCRFDFGRAHSVTGHVDHVIAP